MWPLKIFNYIPCFSLDLMKESNFNCSGYTLSISREVVKVILAGAFKRDSKGIWQALRCKTISTKMKKEKNLRTPQIGSLNVLTRRVQGVQAHLMCKCHICRAFKSIKS